MDVEIDYTNHRGVRSVRRIRPVKLTWGLSEWHPGNQWILLAHCYEKNQPREFAMAEIHAWRPVSEQKGDLSAERELVSQVVIPPAPEETKH